MWDDSIKCLDNIVDLSIKPIETQRHKVYNMIKRVLKPFFCIGYSGNKVKE